MAGNGHNTKPEHHTQTHTHLTPGTPLIPSAPWDTHPACPDMGQIPQGRGVWFVRESPSKCPNCQPLSNLKPWLRNKQIFIEKGTSNFCRLSETIQFWTNVKHGKGPPFKIFLCWNNMEKQKLDKNNWKKKKSFSFFFLYLRWRSNIGNKLSSEDAKNMYKAEAVVTVQLLPEEFKDKSVGKDYKNGCRIAINWIILFLY